MARQTVRRVNPNNSYVAGSAAYDYAYLERERRQRAEREHREYAERMERETARRPAARPKVVEKPKVREKLHVSPLLVLGFAVAAVMLVMILTDYAQLTAISTDVVSMQKELSSLEEDHVALVARYERTFDLTTVKEAAEAAGMAKPSSSQIYYVDLSTPDNVVLYRRENTSVLGRVFTSLGQDVVCMVEYFK